MKNYIKDKKMSGNISTEERILFRNTMRAGISAPATPVSKQPKVSYHSVPPQDSHLILGTLTPQAWCTAEQIIQFAVPSISQRIRHKLKRGQLKIEAELDLHGLSGNQALVQTARFIEECILHGNRCVLLIHGKGVNQTYPGPILKNVMHQWLSQQVTVLAYHSARPKEGGTGALYVLLAKAI